MTLVTATVWERYADVLLQREAALCRIRAGVPPRDFPGLYVSDDDLEPLLRTLPGLDWPDDDAVADVQRAFADPVASARAAFEQWAAGPEGQAGLAGLVGDAGGDLDAAAVLAVVAAAELSPQRERLLAYIQDDVQLPRPTAPTLGRLLPERAAGLRAAAPGGPLRRAELVVVEGTGPWARQTYGVPSRVAWALLGDPTPDPGLPAGAGVRLVSPSVAQDRAPAGAPGGSTGPAPRLLLVHGADAESRRVAAARALGAEALLVTPAPATAAEWAAVVREATVARAGVVLELATPLPPEAAGVVERAGHLAWALSSPRELPLECLPARPYGELAVRDGLARRSDWQGRFGTDPPKGVALTREQLRLVAAAAGGSAAAVPAAVRRLAGGHLDGLAVRVRPRRGWQDLVLPAPQATQLRELVARHRSKATVFDDWGFPAIPSSGAVALFAGPSGTGKTLAAEVVAGELGLDLYKVDLASVVSKYVGETEKNLERIFTAAAAGDLVLFFDEADALFGKRSEVSDSHDRYANIEVAYLLQRLESYDGLVVLATNLQRNIDEAFLRRIGVAVTFPAPDEEQRRQIWSLAFPPGAPVAELDVDFLARQFTVTGGVIRSAALGAAFMAAEDGGAITMERIALALRREFGKLGHLSTASEFDRYFDVVRGEAS